MTMYLIFFDAFNKVVADFEFLLNTTLLYNYPLFYLLFWSYKLYLKVKYFLLTLFSKTLSTSMTSYMSSNVIS